MIDCPHTELGNYTSGEQINLQIVNQKYNSQLISLETRA